MANQLGTMGSELREAVQDPNANKAAAASQPGQVPVGGVITPRGADLSKVGSDDGLSVLGNLLGAGGGILSDYLEKKKDQWNLDGQMAYAQGKTQDEISAAGNQYTMAGFMTMKARVDANTWYQGALNDIQNTDKTIDPSAYSKKLSEGFSQLTESTAGSDPFTKNLLTAQASEMFPRLASQQVESHNAWKMQQTQTSYTDLLVSEATKNDPTDKRTADEKAQALHELTSPAYSGLPDDKHKESLTQALQLSLKLGNDSLFRSLGMSEKQRIEAMNIGGDNPELLSAVHAVGALPGAVQAVESGNNPNAVSPKGAMGLMQVMPATAADPGHGIKPAQDASPEELARVGRDLLQALVAKYNGNTTLALMAYNAGDGTIDKYITKIGNPNDGSVTIQDFVSNFPFKETREYVGKVYAKMNEMPGAATTIAVPQIKNLADAKAAGGESFKGAAAFAAGDTPVTAPGPFPPAQQNIAAQGINTKMAAYSALLRAGFTPAQVETINSSYSQFENKKTTDFNQQRIVDEANVQQAARTTGNLSATLATIQDLKDKNGYSDAWANSLAESSLSAINAGQAQRVQMQKLTNAVATNTLSNLSTSELPEALTVARAQLAGTIQAATPPADVPPEKAQEWKKQQYRSQYTDMLVKNGVVDPSWGASMSSSFVGSMSNKDGSIRQNTTDAYDDYQYLSKASSPAFAQQFLNEDAKAVVNQVDAYAADGLNASQALRTVADINARKANGTYKAPVINQDEVNVLVGNTVKAITPGFFSIFDSMTGGGRYATSWSDLRAGQIERLKQSPILQSGIASQAIHILQAHPEMTPQAAVGQAATDYQARSDYVGDNVVVAGYGSSVRNDMGIKSTAQGAVNQAVNNWVMVNGPKLKDWAGKYNEVQIRGYDEFGNPMATKYTPSDFIAHVKGSAAAIKASIQDLHSGLPKFMVKYNSDNKTFMIDLYTNKEGTRTLNAPQIVNAKELGESYNSYLETSVPSGAGFWNGVTNVLTPPAFRSMNSYKEIERLKNNKE